MPTPKFYVGQKVVAIKHHHRGLFKKGAQFIIKDVRKPPCKCGQNIVDVGFKMGTELMICNDCKGIASSEGIWWIDEDLFAPIIENFQAITFEKVMQEELTSVN